MKKTNFIADRWVKFTFNNVMCIGITYFQFVAEVDVPLEGMVHSISKDRESKIIRFDECHDLRYLQFIQKPGNIKQLAINKEVLTLESQIELQICPSLSRKTIVSLLQNQFNQLSMN